ncbi:MAG: tetratricopeptide repeat protein [Roseomonas sp.]|nr:tetratricopeptide repeat protein [Roseomonas sp.]
MRDTLIKSWIIALALLPGMAAAQSSREEAWRWCASQGAGISRETQITGCSWLINSRHETPQNLAASYFNRANARSKSGDYKGAIADLTEAINVKPDFGVAFSLRAFFRFVSGDRTGAITDFSEAIRLNPRDPEAFSNRGAVRTAVGDHVGAIADYDEAIRLSPGTVTTYVNRGLARAAAGDYAKAIADYTEAIRINPQHASAFLARADARTTQGDLAGAIADYSDAIRINPRDAGVLATRGVLQYRVGEADAARIDIEAAIRLVQPGDGRPHTARAGLALLRGDRTAAIADLSEALRRNNNDSAALGLRAILHAAEGDAAKAAADAAAARRINPMIAEVIRSQFGPELVLP